jgi:hypothetical protein
MAAWQFSESAKRYRNVDSGRFLSPAQEQALRDDFLARRSDAMRAVTAKVGAGDVSVQDWLRQMRSEVKQTYATQYAFGRGGTQAMTAADRRAVGQLVSGQLGYLQRFAEEVSAGRLSQPQAEARASLYANSAVQAHAHGVASAWAIDLPAMPGVGTLCKANCGCSWELEEDDTEIRATWTLGTAESCDTCLERADQYSPYTVAKATEEAA